MSKQKAIGTLADLQSAQPVPETTDTRVDNLEKRVAQLESILNDVMQQLDRPYKDQQDFDGKPHSNEKQKQMKQANPVKPKQAKPKQVKPKQTKPKRVNPPSLPPATEAQTQAHAEAIIAFLNQEPDRLWHGSTLRTAVKDHCATSNQKAILAMKLLRRTGHLVIVKNVEVEGEKLDGAYKFIPQPEPPENPDEQLTIQQKTIALEKAQQAASTQRTARGFEKLQTLLANKSRITSEEVRDAGISGGKQDRIRKTKAFKESGIQYKKLPDETHEYSLESPTD